MFHKRSLLFSCLALALCPIIVVVITAQGPDNKVRYVRLPAESVVSDQGGFVIDATDEAGFISSVIPGALISFSSKSGKVLSSVQFGEMAGVPSMVKVGAERLIALPVTTRVDGENAPSVTIINATHADRMEQTGSVALPSDALLRPDSRALLTKDGRFGVIASSSGDACLFSFNVQTGQIVSRIIVYGEPSHIAMEDNIVGRTVVVANPKLNNIFIAKLDEAGQLQPVGTFIPSDGQFEPSNQPEFSIDGRRIYIAAAKGDRLYAIGAETCMLETSVSVQSPQSITVAKVTDGVEVIGVSRQRHLDGRPGGVTILTYSGGRLSISAEFSPSKELQFLSANNVAFSADASVAFIGSASGILFSIDVKSGRLITYKILKGEIRRIALSHPRTLLVVRSTLTKDDIAVIDTNLLKEGSGPMELPRLKPEIKRISNQGIYTHLLIEGSGFGAGSSVQFAKRGRIVFQQSAIRITENQLTVIVPVKKLKEIGTCEIRVATGNIAVTDSALLEPIALFSTENTVPIQKDSVPESSLAKPTMISSVQSDVTDDSTRVFISTNGDAKIQSFTLADPFRIVIDVFGVRNGVGSRTTRVEGSPIQRIRTGSPAAGVMRVVLDAKSEPKYEIIRTGNGIEVLIRNTP